MENSTLSAHDGRNIPLCHWPAMGSFNLPDSLCGFAPVQDFGKICLLAFVLEATYAPNRPGISNQFDWREITTNINLFVTPSHHRVHHGRNPQYIDRNYGGVLIVFDRRWAHSPKKKNPSITA